MVLHIRWYPYWYANVAILNSRRDSAKTGQSWLPKAKNREAMSAISVFQVKFYVEFTRQAANFFFNRTLKPPNHCARPMRGYHRHNIVFILCLCFPFCSGGYHFQFRHILSNLIFDKLKFRQTQCTKIQFIKMKLSSSKWNSVHQNDNEIQYIKMKFNSSK